MDTFGFRVGKVKKVDDEERMEGEELWPKEVPQEKRKLRERGWYLKVI